MANSRSIAWLCLGFALIWAVAFNLDHFPFVWAALQLGLIVIGMSIACLIAIAVFRMVDAELQISITDETETD